MCAQKALHDDEKDKGSSSDEDDKDDDVVVCGRRLKGSSSSSLMIGVLVFAIVDIFFSFSVLYFMFYIL